MLENHMVVVYLNFIMQIKPINIMKEVIVKSFDATQCDPSYSPWISCYLYKNIMKENELKSK